MLSDLLTTRRAVMIAVIRAYPGGRECAAARLGLSLKRLDNHLYGNNSASPLSDEQIHQLEQDIRTHCLPDYLCQLYGGVFVKVTPTRCGIARPVCQLPQHQFAARQGRSANCQSAGRWGD